MTHSNSSIQNLNINKAALRAVEKRNGFVSKQSFNFAGHYIEGRDGFGSLRVFNDDTVDDGVGIPMHPHVNFEILSVILTGKMEHKDNLGNDLLVNANEVKLMSAGSGLQHGGTCYNHTNFFQIWIVPNQLNTLPVISTKAFAIDERINTWQLQVSPNANDKVLTIKQNLYAYRGIFNQGHTVSFKKEGTYKIFMMPITGSIILEDKLLNERDSAEFTITNNFSFTVEKSSDIWLMVQNL
jgi:quercetin 2,3-dioxygenase